MRKTILAAAAVAALLSIGAPVNEAAAMSAAAPTQLGLPSADGSLVQRTAIVCGYWGCRRVWGGYWGPRPYWGAYWGPPGPYWGWRRPWGWHRPWGWGWRRW